MKTTTWFDLKNTPEGVDLGVTLSGTGAATAKLLPNGLIIVDSDTAEAAKTITLTTPYAMKVLDAMVINGAATAVTVTLKNNATALTDAMAPAAGADTIIARATTLDDAQDDFAVDDDDLVLAVGVAALTGRVIIKIQFT